jgi:hypothetical protein
VVVDFLGVVGRGVLATAIGVGDKLEVAAGLALAERHAQAVEHQVGAHVGDWLPTDDLAALLTLPISADLRPESAKRTANPPDERDSALESHAPDQIRTGDPRLERTKGVGLRGGIAAVM